MTRIHFIEPGGNEVTVDVKDGWSLMQGAQAHGVEGILAECGGSCACATCHCYVDDARLHELQPPTDAERAMLDNVAAERRPNSRLSCQIKSQPALEGLRLTLPETQE